MKKIQIAKGVSFTDIAMGDSKRGNPAFEQSAFAIMDRYVEMGGNTFDSARLYDDGGADRAMGKWLKGHGNRDLVHVVTKGSHPRTETMFTSRLSRQEIEQDLHESLEFMGITHSDLHLLHRDDVKIPVGEIMPILSDLVRSGKTRAIGVSNWTVGRIIEANQFAKENGLEPISCCQLHYSLAQTTAAIMGDITQCPMNEVEYGWYAESQLPVMCFGPQARGWFAVRAAGGEPKPSPKRSYDALPENHKRLQRLVALSKQMGVSLSAITTAYVRDSGLAAIALCSFTNMEQLTEVLEAETFVLTSQQIKYLETGVEL